MEEEPAEKFDPDKLVHWFMLHLKVLRHRDYELADPVWLSENGHVVR